MQLVDLVFDFVALGQIHGAIPLNPREVEKNVLSEVIRADKPDFLFRDDLRDNANPHVDSDVSRTEKFA
jgi:hypothetical protein